MLSRYEGINYILISPEELQIPEYIKKDVFEKKGITFTEVDKMEDVKTVEEELPEEKEQTDESQEEKATEDDIKQEKQAEEKE